MPQSARDAAVLAAARRATKRAADAVRTATRHLAAAGDLDIYAETSPRTPEDLKRLVDIVQLAMTEHPNSVEVVVITTTPRPR
jgi:hypothetical protein